MTDSEAQTSDAQAPEAQTPDESGPVVYGVPGINCDHCVNAITTEVVAVDGVTDVAVDLDAKTVSVIGGEQEAVIAAIDEAGFDVLSS